MLFDGAVRRRAAVVDLMRMDTAHGLHTQDSEHEEHDRQDAREPAPRSGEQRASGTSQVHSEPNSNGMDTVSGNTRWR
ncbi:hypothetical protein GCM10023198_48150 [Promicromonospora umidemergens]|uniref:Uncharacterized protein n=1 Tax=Promicromonospora umidemergens TaxID=629679 RepID=A0ABP8Y1N0_9MICO